MSSIALWLFVVLLGLDLGAGIYEARIVVPRWSSGIPETLQSGNPYGSVAIDAGVRFWAIMTSAVAAAALLSLVLGLLAPVPQRPWQIFASLAELVAVAMTLLYFRPTLVRLFMGHGAGLSATAIASSVRRWVMWSMVRIAISLLAWLAALRALALS